MKASAQRRKSRAQIQEEKLVEEQKQAAIAESASKVVPANSFILQSPAVKKNLDSAFDEADY